MGSSRLIPGVNDLATTMPEVAAEWDYAKNGSLRPQDVMAGSGKRLWWKCARGHEWKTAVYHRKAGHGCPRCAAQKALVTPGVNDLATKAPVIAAQWDYAKNVGRSPRETACYSQEPTWWLCPLGHSWRASVSHRYRGENCPFCSGQRLLTGFNDLATVRPDIAADWNYKKNGSLRPQDVMAGSDLKVWWKCRHGHEWQAYIYSRKAGCGCPYCAGNAILPGFNDLRTLRPDLLLDWDFESNRHVTPEQVGPFSAKMIGWKCRLGHRWKACVYSRGAGKGCPYCAGRKVLPGFNDLLTKLPEARLEWDAEKNGVLTPDNVSAFSHKRFWWKDRFGHSWRASAANRCAGTGCPFCAGKRVLIGFNDLASVEPEIASQWIPERNNGLTPQMVTVNSHKSFWWKCKLGHEWRATVSERRKCGCPYCGNRAVLRGFNDFLFIHPEISEEWDDERNGALKPSDVVFGSHRGCWWKCKLGHSWKASALARHLGSGCPYCAGIRVWPGFNDLATVSPWLLKSWDYGRNAVAPSYVMPFTNQKFWWVCENGHHWRSSPNSRQKGAGCPFCEGLLPSRRRIVP